MNRWNSNLLAAVRILIAVVFLLNGFGIINQAIPAREMAERSVPLAIVPLAMLAGRALEIIAGAGLALGVYPRWCALALTAFLVPATWISHPFWLAAETSLFQIQLINFSKNLAMAGGLLFVSFAQVQPTVWPRTGTVGQRNAA